MLDDIKYELCFIFNEITKCKGVREIEREVGISASTVSRIRNYHVDTLKVEILLNSISFYRKVEFNPAFADF